MFEPAGLTAVMIWFQHEGHEMSGGPHSAWEYVLVAFSVLVLVWVLYLALRMTFRPGEHEAGHIKRTILEDDWEEPADQQKPEKRNSPGYERRSG